METLDMNKSTLGGGSNRFDLDVESPTICSQKGSDLGSLLDFEGISQEKPLPAASNNGHSNGDPELFSLLEQTNGKLADDEDSESDHLEENEEVQKVLGNPFCTKNPFNTENNPFNTEMDQDQFDAKSGHRQETPTPPADEVPGVTGLVSDNVADSGEESEDEWNYYKAEQTGNFTQPSAESQQQTKDTVCGDSAETDAENMESQLNPNAAEFIPSPTHLRQPLDDFLAVQSKAEISMDDVVVPSSSEFEQGASSRPSDLGFDNSFSDGNTSEELPDYGKSNREADFEKFSETFMPQTIKDGADLVNFQESCKTSVLDESEAFSVKADYGDESTTSFMTSGSDFQKTMGLSGNTIMETSLTEQDFLSSDVDTRTDIDIDNKQDEQFDIQKELGSQEFQKEPFHISFELQKEIAPHMEPQPQRVKVESDELSPVLGSQPVSEVPGEISDESPALSPTPEIGDMQIPNEEETAIEHNEFLLQNNAVNAEFVSSKPSDSDVPLEGSHMFEQNSVITQLNDSESLAMTEKLEYGQGDVDEIAASIKNDHLEPVSPLEPLHITNSDILVQEVKGLHLQDFENISQEMKTPEYEKLEKQIEALSELDLEDYKVTNNTVVSQPESIEKSEEMQTVPVIADSMSTEIVNDSLLLHTENKDDLIINDTPTPPPTPAQTTDLHTDEKPESLTQAVEKLVEETSSQAIDYSELTTSVDENQTVPLEVHDLAVAAQQIPSGIEIEKYTSDVPEIKNEIETAPVVESIQSPIQFCDYTVPLAVQDLPVTSEVPESDNVQNQLEVDIHQVESLLLENIEAKIESTLPAVDVPVGTEVPLIVEDLVANESPVSEIHAIPDEPLVTEEHPVPKESQVAVSPVEIDREIKTLSQTAEEPCIEPSPVADISPIMQEIPIETSPIADISPVIDIIPVVDVTPIANVEPAAVESSAAATATAAATAAATATAAAATSAVVAASTTVAAAPAKKIVKKDTTSKDALAKKPTSLKDKKPTTERPKSASTKPAAIPSRTLKPKSPPSLLKPSLPKPSPTKKPATSTTAQKPLLKTTASSTSAKPTSNTSPTKPISRITNVKPRPASSTIDKKPLTNGDVSKPLPKSDIAKTLPSRPLSRPISAPASKPLSSTSPTVPKPKSMLGTTNKPKLSAVAHARTSNKTNEKEIKDTANKQISSTRSISSTVRSPAASTATRTSTLVSTRKIESKTTNGRESSLKTTTKTASSKVMTAKKTTRVSQTGKISDKSETVQRNTVITTNVKSEAIIENPTATT